MNDVFGCEDGTFLVLVEGTPSRTAYVVVWTGLLAASAAVWGLLLGWGVSAL